MSFYDTTNKCCALRSWSNPVLLSLEVGRGPVSWLSARSSQVTLESLPNEGGMLPVSLFEFRAKNVSCDKFPSSLGTGPLKLQPINAKDSSLNNFPMAAGNGPPRSLFEDRSKIVSSVRLPISSLRVPPMPIPNRFSDVTLPFSSHKIPSHGMSQGLDFPQLAGTFFHLFIKDLRAASSCGSVLAEAVVDPAANKSSSNKSCPLRIFSLHGPRLQPAGESPYPAPLRSLDAFVFSSPNLSTSQKKKAVQQPGKKSPGWGEEKAEKRRPPMQN